MASLSTDALLFMRFSLTKALRWRDGFTALSALSDFKFSAEHPPGRPFSSFEVGISIAPRA